MNTFTEPSELQEPFIKNKLMHFNLISFFDKINKNRIFNNLLVISKNSIEMHEETIKCVRLFIDHSFSGDNQVTHVSKRNFPRKFQEI